MGIWEGKKSVDGEVDDRPPSGALILIIKAEELFISAEMVLKICKESFKIWRGVI